MTLHEQPTEELKQQVAAGSLSPKKVARAEAVLRHRRAERTAAWLGRHAWIAALLTVLGLARFLLSPRN